MVQTMSRQALSFCLFFVLFLHAEGQVCTTTIQTFKSTFILSNCNYPDCYGKPPQMKSLTVHDPIIVNKQMCCPGYCIMNKNRPISNDNCMKLCEKDCVTESCRNKEMCFFRDVYIDDLRSYECQTAAPKESVTRKPKQINENKTCLFDNCTVNTVYPEAIGNYRQCVLNKEHLNESISCLNLMNCSDILINEDVKHGSSGFFVYVSLIANVILLTILVIMIYRHPGAIKCCTRKDQINSNAFDPNNEHYVDMGGATRRTHMNRPPLIREKSDHEASNGDPPLRYDYVQVPLPVNQRLYEEIPNGR